MAFSEQSKTAVTRRTALSLGAMAMGLVGLGSTGQATNYPTKPIKIIVPYTPGGTTDIVTRMVGEPLSKVLGQPVVVENRPGANSIVGAGAAASSPPDGYTLVMVLPAHAANATLQAGKIPFDPVASFSPISLVVTAPLVLAGAKKVPATTFREYLEYARARPGAVNYGSSGIGATAHLAMELLQLRTGVKMVHVPYRGTQPALQDLISGNISLMFDSYSTLKPQIEAGTIRPLGIAMAKRAPFAPDLPTLAEQGLDDFAVSTWCMLLAPAGTSQAIVDRLSTEVRKIVHEPAMTAKFQDLGFIIEGRSPAETGEFLRSEVERWRAVIRQANVVVE